jgi:hypothetical protein
LAIPRSRRASLKQRVPLGGIYFSSCLSDDDHHCSPYWSVRDTSALGASTSVLHSHDRMPSFGTNQVGKCWNCCSVGMKLSTSRDQMSILCRMTNGRDKLPARHGLRSCLGPSDTQLTAVPGPEVSRSCILISRLTKSLRVREGGVSMKEATANMLAASLVLGRAVDFLR